MRYYPKMKLLLLTDLEKLLLCYLIGIGLGSLVNLILKFSKEQKTKSHVDETPVNDYNLISNRVSFVSMFALGLTAGSVALKNRKKKRLLKSLDSDLTDLNRLRGGEDTAKDSTSIQVPKAKDDTLVYTYDNIEEYFASRLVDGTKNLANIAIFMAKTMSTIIYWVIAEKLKLLAETTLVENLAEINRNQSILCLPPNTTALIVNNKALIKLIKKALKVPEPGIVVITPALFTAILRQTTSVVPIFLANIKINAAATGQTFNMLGATLAILAFLKQIDVINLTIPISRTKIGVAFVALNLIFSRYQPCGTIFTPLRETVVELVSPHNTNYKISKRGYKLPELESFEDLEKTKLGPVIITTKSRATFEGDYRITQEQGRRRYIVDSTAKKAVAPIEYNFPTRTRKTRGLADVKTINGESVTSLVEKNYKDFENLELIKSEETLVRDLKPKPKTSPIKIPRSPKERKFNRKVHTLNDLKAKEDIVIDVQAESVQDTDERVESMKIKNKRNDK